MPANGLTEEQIVQAIQCVASYLGQQRDYYMATAVPLSASNQALMRDYFSSDLLRNIKAVELHGERIPNPSFYEQARTMGFMNLPDVAHMNSMTFPDLMVFNEQLTERSLFHALVHAVQFAVLGLERYSELFVRSFVSTRFHFMVPLEAHAFFLESKFARPGSQPFSAEDQVRLWAKQNRY